MSLSCRAQAIALGQALVDGRWLDCVTHHDQLFRDEYALYRPLQVISDQLMIPHKLEKRYFEPSNDSPNSLKLATRYFDASHVGID